MSLRPRLELKQTQRLSMTPQLRQAIQLLQMTNTELAALLEAEAEKNPLLEVIPPAPARQPPTHTPAHGAGGDFDPAQNIAAKPGLREELTAQIRQSERDPARIALACHLIDELDENGFLGQSVTAIAARLGQPPTAVSDALTLLQSCEPTGIGARDLQECLRLQLVENGQDSPELLALVGHLDLLASGDFAKLSKILGISAEALDQAVSTIQRLNPRPASGYDHNMAQTAVPDIFVTRSQDDTWRVELNTNALPKVLVNDSYTAEVSAGKTREYLAECQANARFLVRAMDQRAKTMLRVATAVVTHQSRFFDSGLSRLRPLTLAEIATTLDLHEATVSRVTRGKFLECPRGNFPMRFFFAGSVASADSTAPVATPVVQDRIRALVAQETAENVLSDLEIVKTLQAEGIHIARRTVAKYRNSMGIASSSRRRRKLL